MSEHEIEIRDELTEFLLYTTPDAGVRVEIFLHDETVWLTQKRLAELFGVDRSVVTKHLKNIFDSGELLKNSVCAKIAHTAEDGKTYRTNYYNLDAILSVGYRVNSSQATQFRIWASTILKEYILKGFAMDDDRLKNGRFFGKDYFREMLERVRSIRSSERRIYQQITDIFAECSVDYDWNSGTAKNFYANIQNKFHFAIAGMTAAEIVHKTADHQKPFMGLKTWKSAPKGRILKSDVSIAKNYLVEKEIKKLERVVSGYFDYIERLLENRTALTMAGLAESVNNFLGFNEYRILDGLGTVSHQVAKNKAESEYDEFNKTQKIESDFDRFARQIEQDDKEG